MDECLRGLKKRFTKPPYSKEYRGFESHLIRQNSESEETDKAGSRRRRGCGQKKVFKLISIIMVSIILFILPFVSGIFLLTQSYWQIVLTGLAIIILTPIVISLLFPLEKTIFKKIHPFKLSYVTPIYYFILVVISISLSWFLINSEDIGNVWFFLFALSCCFVPYSYMLQGEQAKTGRVGVLTSVINNYSVLGYLIFGSIMNFTSVPIIWAYLVLIGFGAFLLNGLPKKLRVEMSI